MQSHRNVVAACGGIGKIPSRPICETDVYIAYLPLAHVLELTAELTVLAYGGALGYSSPLTLRDDGCCDSNGKPAGDLSMLKPTLMAAVPLILDRLRAAVQEQVSKSNFITRSMFNLAFRIKKRRYLANEESPILDRLVFKKVAAKFGGRIRYLLSGGAPLSGETHEVKKRHQSIWPTIDTSRLVHSNLKSSFFVLLFPPSSLLLYVCPRQFCKVMGLLVSHNSNNRSPCPPRLLQTLIVF